MARTELDAAVPTALVTSFSWSLLTGDLAICTANGIYLLVRTGGNCIKSVGIQTLGIG